jgi:hypothetical protein
VAAVPSGLSLTPLRIKKNPMGHEELRSLILNSAKQFITNINLNNCENDPTAAKREMSEKNSLLQRLTVLEILVCDSA